MALMPNWIEKRLRQRRRQRFTKVRRREALDLDTNLVDTAAYRHWEARSLHPVIDPAALSWIGGTHLYSPSVHGTFEASIRLANPDPDEDEFDQLPAAVLTRFAETLADHTRTPFEARMCAWEGYGYPWSGNPSGLGLVSLYSDDPGPWPWPVLPSIIRDGPKATLDTMDRKFVVFAGPVTAAARFGWDITEGWFQPKWPDLVYPTDHAWLTYSDIDEDTVDVHGTAALIDILTSIVGLTTEPLP